MEGEFVSHDGFPIDSGSGGWAITVPLRLAACAGRTIPWPLPIIPSIIGGSTASLTIGGRALPLVDLANVEPLGTIGPVTETAGSIANLDEARFIAVGPVLLLSLIHI